MNHRWAARAVVAALHAALLLALWQHRPARLDDARERRSTTVQLILPRRPPPPPSEAGRMPPPARAPALAAIEPRPFSIEAPAAPEAERVPASPAPAAPTQPAEPPRAALRLTLPPGYAASSAAARNPALSDPRSNTPRATLEDRIADATGGAGAWVEESTSENRLQSVGALGEYRTVMRRGNTCVEVFRSRIADNTAFNGNVAPLAMRMVGKPYTCRGPGR
ncbi:hypothetical protein ACG04Q_13680 [Roseateles sp. DXS20W]|uniref:DUF3617 family protein n=1 Tax=Pelomonas lactea TaxID=3299030 RepID=A0ABW7GLA1_9BURK